MASGADDRVEMARAENLNIATVHVRLGNARRQQGELASAEAEYRLARVLFESLAPEILSLLM